MKMRKPILSDWFRGSGRVAITAHSTYIGRYPENSLAGIQAAAEIGCDFVEFDVRTTKDGIPVLMHDPTLDRTVDIHGRVKDFTFAELQKMNISHYQYFPDCSGRTLRQAQMEYCPVASLEEVLDEFGKKILMNIQVYERDPAGLKRICELFKAYSLYDRAYLTMENFQAGQQIRALDPDIELCVLERPLPDSRTTIAMLHNFHDFGCRIAQPRWYDITPEYCEASHELGIFSNVYYANSISDARRFIDCGIDGILTDYPDVILQLLRHETKERKEGKSS